MRKRGGHWLFRAALQAVCLWLCLGARLPASIAQTAHDQELLARQPLLITKALTYDSRLISRVGAQVTIAVVYKPGHAGSEQAANDWHKRFNTLKNVRFLGLPFSTILLPLRPVPEMRATLRDQGVDAILVCPGLDADLPQVTQLTHEMKIISIASVPSQIQQGLSMGVFIIDGKNTLHFNLAATREEGALFASDILKLAKVIK